MASDTRRAYGGLARGERLGRALEDRLGRAQFLPVGAPHRGRHDGGGDLGEAGGSPRLRSVIRVAPPSASANA
jgi:hypothetical protein